MPEWAEQGVAQPYALSGPLLMPMAGLEARHKFFVVGNHEYYHGSLNDVKPWEGFFRKALNFTVLHNDAVRLDASDFPERDCGATDSLTVVGVPDLWQGDPDLPAAAAELITSTEDNREWILMSHQPGQIVEARDMTPHVGLQVSGHVHAGRKSPSNPLPLPMMHRPPCVNCQCTAALGWPSLTDCGVVAETFPLHPIVWAVQQGRFSGLYKEKDSFLYVSNGQSNWGPRVRLYSTPENTVLGKYKTQSTVEFIRALIDWPVC